jgi:isoleucyl-tRNA synthetase
MPKVRELLTGADGATIRRSFEQEGRYRLELDGTTIVIEPDDVEIRAAAHEELAVVQDGALAVALDTTIDDDLRLEGLARELVRALNDLRKERGLDLADRVRLELRAEGLARRAAERHAAWIAGEVLAVDCEIVDGSLAPGDAVVEIDGSPVGVRLEPVR